MFFICRIFTAETDSTSQLRAVAKEVAVGDKKVEYVEIWRAETRVGVYDPEISGLHGKISTKGPSDRDVVFEVFSSDMKKT